MDLNAKYTVAGVSVLAVLLIATVVGVLLATRTLAPSPGSPREATAETPSRLVNGAPLSTVPRVACSPLNPGYTGLVPCAKQATCNGCTEFADGTTPYSCVNISGGNGAVGSDGKLVQPTRVTYNVPVTEEECSGHGAKNDNDVCVCAEGFSGSQCQIYTQDIFTPGSYCLPSYALQCASPTTLSVLNNYNTGAGGQYTCACKPEFEGLYVQLQDGGLCDTPLICNASAPQMAPNQQTAQLYSVATGSTDASGAPLFAPQAVYTNRVGTHDMENTEACVAKTGAPVLKGSGNGGKPYYEINVAPDADPTCKPTLDSNLCVALGQTGVLTKVRGSGRPNDPLIERVSPGFYPPVPSSLQRCPDGFAGLNTPNYPCTCACAGQTGCPCKANDVLQLKPLATSYCKNPDALTPTTPRTYDTTWRTAIFDESGEWNGAMSCLHDLRNAKARFNPTDTEKDVSSLAWTTVNGSTQLGEVQCMSGYNSTDWITRADYTAGTQTYPYRPQCVGPACTGVMGRRIRNYDGNRDGALTDDMARPWFAAPLVPGTVAQPNYGGQCECKGVAYRRVSTSNGSCASGKCTYPTNDVLAYQSGMACSTSSDCALAAVPLVAQRLNPDGGPDAWWKCSPDTCWSLASPTGHLDASDPKFPVCVCNTKPGAMSPPYTTMMSYRPPNELPKCVPDACNPLGYKVEAKVECADDNGCGGKCYNNRCHYPVSTDAQTCTTDEQCNALSYGANTGRCISVTLSDGTQTKKCAYEDVDRANAGTYCTADTDCSYGRCVTTGSNMYGLPVQKTCSGGCACSKEAVQVIDNQNPVGFRCALKCTTNPCKNGGTCVIDGKGKQTCVCSPCFTGDRCQYTAAKGRLGEACKPGQYGGDCCTGSCVGGKCV